MAIKSARWTRDELERFPDDGNRYEVLHGQLLVTPQASLDHQIIAMRLAAALYAYCEAHRAGIAVGPGAVIFGKSELQPDFEILPPGSVKPRKKWDETPCPILVVEVLSPFAVSRRRDLSIKKDAYLRLGIATYWVVDHDERRVHVWSAGNREEVITTVLRWQPVPNVAPFELQLAELFRPAGE